MHKMVVEQEKALIRFSVHGFLDEAQFDAFDDALRVHVRDLRRTAAAFDVLADLREVMVVPQPLAERLGRQMQWLGDNGLRRSANIMASTLLALQMKRVSKDERFSYFTTEVEALGWIED